MTKEKKQYNELLARYKNAEEYLDNAGIELSEREKHIPLALEVIKELNRLLQEIKAYSENEVLHGFK